MSRRQLFVYHESKRVGILREDENALLHFTYDPDWNRDKEAFPLCLAMALRDESYGGKLVTSFFENLIPEGEQRRQIEQFAGLPQGDDAAYLERFGEDCAGAFSLSVHPTHSVPPDKAPEFHVPFKAIESSIAKGLPISTVLSQDGELLPFSLAGAQAKFPCRIHDGLIYLPGGKEPTTHIVKLPIRSGEKLLDSVENEYLSMRLAKLCGLNVPEVALVGDSIPLFVIERFDRQATLHEVHRIHTQDFCQALGRPSSEKYEKHGGPSFSECYVLLQNHSSDVARDLFALLDWIGFNLALGNNDSHAKNISLVLSRNGIRLAPFYDLICTALYPQYNAHFAFKIAEVTSWDKITRSRMDAFARQCGLRGNFVISRWLRLFDRMKVGFAELKHESTANKHLQKTVRKIGQELEKRISSLSKNLQNESY